MSNKIVDRIIQTCLHWSVHVVDDPFSQTKPVPESESSCDTDYFLVDGGFTDWTQKLLSNRKERLLISGLGSERLLTCFK